jgi:hypothetical protein
MLIIGLIQSNFFLLFVDPEHARSLTYRRIEIALIKGNLWGTKCPSID